MTLTWLISGAHRGVGRTYLAEQLLAVLPESVCLRKGRRKSRPDRPVEYYPNDAALGPLLALSRRKFKHVVVETNTQLNTSRKGVFIFLDARPGAKRVRRDAARLRAGADIRVGGGEPAQQWREILEGRLDNGVVIDLVIDILADQEAFTRKRI